MPQARSALVPLALLFVLAAASCDETEAAPSTAVKDTFTLAPKITVRGTWLTIEVPDVEKAEITVVGRTVTAVSEPAASNGNKWLAVANLELYAADLKPGPQTLEVVVKDHFGHEAKVPVELDFKPRPALVWGSAEDRKPGWTYEGDAVQYRVVIPNDYLGGSPVVADLDAEGNLTTTVSGPAGTKFTVGGQAFTIEKDEVVVKLSLLDELAAIDAGKLIDGNTVTEIELPIEYDGGGPIDTLSVQALKLAAGYFRRATSQPALFPGETAKPGAKRSMLSFPGGSLYGSAAKISDVDLAAYWTTTEKRLSVCKYAGNYEFHRTVATSHVVVVDRRAGKVIARKDFSTKEDTKCPRSIADRPDASGSSQTFAADASATRPWMESQIAK